MKNVLVFGVVMMFSVIASASTSSHGESSGVTADMALQKLMDGNKRFVEASMNGYKRADESSRTALTKGQKPYAIILSCSDSRVPPELLFDQGLGEIFVVRVAGNIPDPVILGSIEYAAEHLGSPLVMVLGHERCGAVTATVEGGGSPEGNINTIIRRIYPAAEKAKKSMAGKEKTQIVEAAIDENIRLVMKNLTTQSSVLKHLSETGKIKIMGAKYDLDDGKVNLF